MSRAQELRNYITETFLFDENEALNDDDSFMEKGIIDSTGILQLVLHLQERYKIQVNDEELVPENFDSINQLVAFVKRKTAPR